MSSLIILVVCKICETIKISETHKNTLLVYFKDNGEAHLFIWIPTE